MSEPRLALVVGANRGLGLGLVRVLHARGWQVIGTARDPDAAEALNALAATSGGAVTVTRCDIDEPTAGAALARHLEGRPLDLLFVNAGVSGPAHRSADQATAEEIGALMLTNAVAPVRLARTLLDSVRPGTGVVAFMSSVMGSITENTGGNHELYRASKAALNSFTRGLWATIGDRNLTVLSIHPGWVRTDMGGEAAALSVEESVAGIVDVVEREAGSHRHAFLDYQGREIGW